MLGLDARPSGRHMARAPRWPDVRRVREGDRPLPTLVADNVARREGEAEMCRWLVYSGSPVPLEAFLYQPEHSLIDQSLNAKLGTHTTNGDGFGVGWYGGGNEAGRYKRTDTALGRQKIAGPSPPPHPRPNFSPPHGATRP